MMNCFTSELLLFLYTMPVTLFQDNLQLHTVSYSSTNCSSCSHQLVKHFVHKCYLYVANYHNDTLWPVYIVMFVYCGSTALALSLTFEVSIKIPPSNSGAGSL